MKQYILLMEKSKWNVSQELKRILLSALLWFVVFSMIVSMVGCKKTPSYIIMADKDSEDMIEMAKNEHLQENNNEIGLLVDEESQRFIGEVIDAKHNLYIYMDAAVEVPTVEAMKISRITNKEFSSEDIEKIYELFCGEMMSIGRTPVFTKEFKLKSYQPYLDMWRSNIYPDMQFDSLDDFGKAIAMFMSELNNYPDGFTHVEPIFEFDEYGFANCYAASDAASVSLITVQNAGGLSVAKYYRDALEKSIIDNLHNDYATNFIYTKDKNYICPSIKLNDARDIAVNTVYSINGDDWLLSAEREICIYDAASPIPPTAIKGAYEFIFTPSIEGIPLVYADGSASEFSPQDTYASPRYYEAVYVIIDEEGVKSYYWEAPFKQIEKVVDIHELLSFSEIQEIFKYIAPKDFKKYVMNDSVCEVFISRVSLGYMHISEQNSKNTGLIVPVWDFWGTVRNDKCIVGESGYTSLLTINAIDGTIINRGKGY